MRRSITIVAIIALSSGCYTHLGVAKGAYLNSLPPMCVHPVIDMDGRHVRTDELQARVERDGQMSSWTSLCGNAGNKQLRVDGEVLPVADDATIELRSHNKGNQTALIAATTGVVILASLIGLLAYNFLVVQGE